MSSERKNIEKIILGCRETLNPKYERGVTDERRKFNCSSSRQYECPFKFFGKYCQFEYLKKKIKQQKI